MLSSFLQAHQGQGLKPLLPHGGGRALQQSQPGIEAHEDHVKSRDVDGNPAPLGDIAAAPRQQPGRQTFQSCPPECSCRYGAEFRRRLSAAWSCRCRWPPECPTGIPVQPEGQMLQNGFSAISGSQIVDSKKAHKHQLRIISGNSSDSPFRGVNQFAYSIIFERFYDSYGCQNSSTLGLVCTI